MPRTRPFRITASHLKLLASMRTKQSMYVDRAVWGALVRAGLVEADGDGWKLTPAGNEVVDQAPRRRKKNPTLDAKFMAAARKIERAIAAHAKEGGEHEDTRALYKAIDRLDDRASKPELRGSPERDQYLDICSDLRRSVRPAEEAAQVVRTANRQAEIARLRLESRRAGYDEIGDVGYGDKYRVKNPKRGRRRKNAGELYLGSGMRGGVWYVQRFRDGDAIYFISDGEYLKNGNLAGVQFSVDQDRPRAGPRVNRVSVSQHPASVRLWKPIPEVDVPAKVRAALLERKENPRGRRRNDFTPAMSPAVARRQRKQLGREIAAHHKAANLDKLRALRHAIGEARQSSKRLRKEAIGLCAIGRTMAKERAKAIRIEGRQKIRDEIDDERLQARGACELRKAMIRENVKSAVVRARAELKEEKRYQREIRGIDQRQRKERPKSTAAERRGESDDAVRDNIPPDLVPLFERVKRQIKGTDRETRTESFLRYAEENQGEVAAAIGREAEKEIARLQREEAKESRALRRRGVSAAELAAVPF